MAGLATKQNRTGGDPWRLGARALASAIARGELSATAAVEAHIARIEAVDPSLHALVWRRFDEARREARELDRRRAQGEPLGPLAGVPVTIKESLDFAGAPSTFGIASQTAPAVADDPYVARLRRAGAIVLGKTNVAQFLAYYESDNPVYGKTCNPWDVERTPGGSSGGEAALLAAGGSALGLGTDIGGSSRVPAAFCGIVGLKPTAGRLPDPGRGSFAVGQRAIASQIGVLGRSVADVAFGLTVANGDQAPAVGDPARVDPSALRVGYFVDDGVFPVAAAYRRAVGEAAAALRRRGATVVELEPVAPREAFELFYRILSADRFAHGRAVLGRSPRDERVKQIEQTARTPRILLPVIKALLRASGRRRTCEVIDCFGPYDAAGHFAVVARQLEYQARWLRALDAADGGPLDAVLSPATALPAPRHGATVELGLMGTYANLYNVLGWPAGVVPVTRVRADEETAVARGRDVADRTATESERGSAGLPIAVQVAGRPWREDVVLALLGALEAECPRRGDIPSLVAG